MKHLKRFSLSLLFALPITALAEPLVPFEAEMEVTRYGLVDISADGHLRLRQNDAGEWHYQLYAETRLPRRRSR